MTTDLRYHEGKKVSLIALLINGSLAMIKIAVGYIFHSRAMIADGIHSSSDSLTTIIVLLSLKIASNPPDSCHPYGHERSETLAANVLALLLIITGFLLIKDNVTSILTKNLYYPGIMTILAGILSIIGQEINYRYAIHIGRKIKSPALIADAMHHRSDAISSIAAVAGIIAARNGLPILDPIAGLIVAGMIITMGINIFKETVQELMEHSPDIAYLSQITEVAKKVSQVGNVTDLKVRKHATTEFIEMTITVPSKLSVSEGDQIAHRVRDQVIANIPHHQIKDVRIHVDPYELKPSQ